MGNLESLFFYIIIYAVSTGLFSFHKSKNKIIRYAFVFLAILLPSILAGMRYNVGTDYKVYDWNVTYIRGISLKNVVLNNTVLKSTEYGFLLLTKLLTYIGSNKVVFGIIAFIMLSLVAVTLIKEYSDYYISISYFMYLLIYFTNSFNIIRQGLALAIVFWGYKYIFEHKIKKYVIVILIATLFHYSALIALPAYFFWNYKSKRAINNEKFSIIFAFSLIIVALWRKIYVIAINMGFSWIKKYEGYLNNNSAITRNRDFYVKAILFFIILLFFMYTRMKNQKMKFYLQMYSLNLVIALTGFYITFVKRIGLYYEIPAIILVAALPRGVDKRFRYIVLTLCTIVLIMYFILVFYIVGDADIIPYRI